MKKRVILLAVSCKTGGLCPGGLDLDDPSQWIRIVSDDGCAGSVRGFDIAFSEPLDIIEFDGEHRPIGKQRENWIINPGTCKKVGRLPKEYLARLYERYAYHGLWGSNSPYLTEFEFNRVSSPSESIVRAQNIRIYKNSFDKWKISFEWEGGQVSSMSMTDPSFYGRDTEVTILSAYLIISIPKDLEFWGGRMSAYKFVSKVFEMPL